MSDNSSCPYVFVSYSHEDGGIVGDEIARLRGENLDIRFDENLADTRDWAEVVAPLIRDSAVLLFYVSPDSIKSRNCYDEVEYARTHQLPILLSFLSETELPPGWQLRIGNRQALYRNRENRGDYENRLSTRLAGYVELDSPILGPTDLGSEPTIAVLPFSNATQRAALGHVADSLALEVHALLRFRPGIRLIARTSSFAEHKDDQQPVDVGRELGADEVLTGMVSAVDDEFQIAIELVRVADGKVVLEWKYLTSELATANPRIEIVEAIFEFYEQKFHESSPSLRIRTSNEEAYRAYVAGQTNWNRQDLVSLMAAIENYQEAVEQDPDYFDAHIAMAKAYLTSHSMGTQKSWAIEKANSAIEAARRVMHRTDERSRQELSLQSAYCYRIDHWSGGLGYEEHIIRSMIEADPSDYAAYGEYGEGILMHSGLYNEAIEYLKVGEAHDPQNVTIKQSLALLYASVGNFSQAYEKLNNTLTLDSDNVLSITYRASLAARLGNAESADRDLRYVVQFVGEDHILLKLLRANCAGWFGEMDEARKLVSAMTEANAPDQEAEYPFLMGVACASLSDLDGAFAYWQCAGEQQDRLLHHIRSHVTYFCSEDTASVIAEDDRYAELLKGIGMDKKWSEEAQRRARTLTAITGIPVGPIAFP